MKNKTKIFLVTFISLLILLFLIIPMLITYIAYESNFGMRVDVSNSSYSEDYFDMLIHHPECAVADPKIIENITNNGLYKVIEYIFNNNT